MDHKPNKCTYNCYKATQGLRMFMVESKANGTINYGYVPGG